MDREVVEQKLESLRRCLQRIETKCPADADTLAADFDLQDIVSLNLSRAVQLCVDIGAHLISGLDVPPPDTMGQTFDLLAQAGLLNVALARNLKNAVGFRNIAVHNYDAINWRIVHSIVKNHLQDFSEFAKVVAMTIMEEEVRQILRRAVSVEGRARPKLGSRIAARFADAGLTEPLPELRGQSITPMSFGA